MCIVCGPGLSGYPVLLLDKIKEELSFQVIKYIYSYES